jgi:PIN domain nuclease of toxin-antitoxin system
LRILLDTNIIVWLLKDDPRLSKSARELLQTPARNVYFSVASLWEIGIKNCLGRLDLSPGRASEGMRKSGFQRLQITDEHLDRLVLLPAHHRDPFDRMLVAQAFSEPLRLLTSDQLLRVYGENVIVV